MKVEGRVHWLENYVAKETFEILLGYIQNLLLVFLKLRLQNQETASTVKGILVESLG